jgi:butyryl-CoA dehydrogenase
MDDSFLFTEQNLAVRNMVREFARDEVAPIARKFDDSGEFPWDTVNKMADLGLLGMPWPEELGGAGVDLICYILVIHVMANVVA